MQYSILDQMKDRLNYGKVGEGMGNFSESANTGNAGQLGDILSMVGSYFGPIGAGAGKAVGSLVDSGGHVRAVGEDYSPGQNAGKAFVEGAVANYLEGEANTAAGDLFGKGVEQAADKTVQAGGNSLLASDAAGATMGDAYKVSLADGMQLQVDPNMTNTQPISNGARPTMQTGSQPSTMGSVYQFGKDQLNGFTQGLFDPDVKPTDQVKDFTLENAMRGYNSGSSLGKIRANMGEGNYASAVGGGARFVQDNYRPPEEDKMIQKMRIRY